MISSSKIFLNKNGLPRLGVWLRAARLPFLTATLIPVALGTSISWWETARFDFVNFLLVLSGVALLHCATNLTNDYFDHKSGNDEINNNPTPFSGGSRVIQEKLIKPNGVFIFALACFVLGSLIGLWLNYQLKTNVILIMGIVGVFLGFFYTAYPLKIGYTGLGELIVGLCFGPLVVLGSYYVQARSFSWAALWGSVPIGILVGLVLYINEFPDYEADSAVGKKTLVVRLGKQRAVKLYHLLLGAAYLSLILGVVLKAVPAATLITLFSAPIALKALIVSRNNFDRIYELLPANASTIALHSLFGLLLCAGFILHKVF